MGKYNIAAKLYTHMYTPKATTEHTRCTLAVKTHCNLIAMHKGTARCGTPYVSSPAQLDHCSRLGVPACVVFTEQETIPKSRTCAMNPLEMGTRLHCGAHVVQL